MADSGGYSFGWQSGRDMDAATDKSQKQSTTDAPLWHATGEKIADFAPPLRVNVAILAVAILAGYYFLTKRRK